MCIVIDANVAPHVFDKNSAFYAPVLTWLFSARGGVVYGGTLGTELFKIAEARKALVALKRAGTAFEVPPSAISNEENTLHKLALHTSNDVHVLAVLRLSGSRSLVSNDRALINDLHNQSLLPLPKGKALCSLTSNGVAKTKALHPSALTRFLAHTKTCRRPKV